MYKQLTVVGMVLSVMPIRDYDKRLVILTSERGKIHAFAKGARKPGSPYLAACQPFSFGEFDLIEGHSAYTVTGVRISNYFAELRGDITLLCYGLYFCEFAEYITREGSDEKDVLKLLYQSMRAVAKPQIGAALVRYIFDFRMVYINGEGPQVSACVKCGSRGGGMFFSAKAGGVLCTACRNPANHANHAKHDLYDLLISDTALYTLQFILSQPIEKLFTFTVTDAILMELKTMAQSYLRVYIGQEMKALQMLDQLS